MVESITPFPDRKCVHVKLGYQASVKNATAKLGLLSSSVIISKLSAFVEESEISLLADLRSKYGIGPSDDCEEKSRPKATPRKRSRYIPGPEAIEEDSEQECE